MEKSVGENSELFSNGNPKRKFERYPSGIFFIPAGLLIPAKIIREKASNPGSRLWQTGKKDPDSGFHSSGFKMGSRLWQTGKKVLTQDFHSQKKYARTRADVCKTLCPHLPNSNTA